MNLRQLASNLIRAYRISPKKRLGQHFMVDEYLLQLLVSHADLKQTDVVLEVGAGFGFLTRMLAEKSDRVLAVEADPNLIGVLRRELAGLDNVQIIVGDFLKAAIPPFNKVVCNPPFSISSPLLFRILERAFDSAVMTFQREFARRLNA
ncbi:methyltransferase, partial [Candidatus Bathyarchaeota archaeon]|nr:methyltransferase [Candidatus Bathyarchaeota archaeon]